MGDGGGGFRGRDLSDPLSDDEGSGWQELELDPNRQSGSVPRDPLVHGGGREIGDPFDLGPGSGDLPGLELDTDAIRPSSPGASAPPVQRSFAPPREPDVPGASHAGRRSSPAASGSHPSLPASSEPSPTEVAALADYGRAPDGIFGAVPYAVLVFTRRRALSRALGDLRRLRTTARNDARETIVELGRALHERGDAGELAPLSHLLSAADAAGRVAGQKTEEWTKAREVADTQRASLGAKIEQAEKAAGPYRDQETKLATQMNVREQDLRRAKARLQRVEIELRNLATSSAPDASKQQMLEAERATRRADVDKAQGHVDELAPQLAAARRELTVVLEAVNDLERQRRAVDDAQSRSERLHLSTAGEAEKDYEAAVIPLAEHALERGIADAVAPERAKAARLMRSALASREREVALHEAALGAYDEGAFQKGAAILGGAAFVILVMLVLVIVR